MSLSNQNIELLEQLLADEATDGLEASASNEIEDMLESGGGPERDDFMRVASLMQMGFLKQDKSSGERLPDNLREKLAEQANEFFGQQANQAPASSVTDIRSARKPREEHATAALPTKRSWLHADRAGWAVAATLLLAFFVLRPDQAPTSPDSSTTQQRAALMASANTIIAPWASGIAADGYEDVTGDVVWSDIEQAGYMRLSGLVANNAANAQYQLWIVDPDRDERPVDGGVFNVPAGVDEIIIPIDAKLKVGGPAAFAITLEQPGGVVVSAGPLLVVAPVTG
ncbi:MAG: anti-sigma factor [Gammaproteobacteria bacterium]